MKKKEWDCDTQHSFKHIGHMKEKQESVYPSILPQTHRALVS